MKYLILALVLISGTGNAFAQKKNPETYGKSITATDLRNHLYIVAGPGMEGRETATEGQRKAAAYLVSQFRALGLEPANNGSYEQVFHVHQDSLTDAKVEVNGTTFQINQDFLPGFSSNISGTFRFSEVVVAGTKSLDSLKTASLGGKLVMVFGTPQGGRGQQGGNIFTTLQQKGVAGILVVQSNFPRMLPVSRRGNQTMSLFKRMIAPQQYMVSETIARAIVGSAFDSVKANETGVMTFPANVLLETQKITTTLQSTNVMAMVPGTDKKDEYLFITAHYDHLGKRGDSIIYYGADDDGSGTVSLLEIAEGFMKAKAAGRGPRRTIVFMAVSGEEKGLWGSDYYSSHPVFPLEKTTVNL
ncbi:MAG TPA: M28 family peptidase, partial [Flavisolibacter sp.]